MRVARVEPAQKFDLNLQQDLGSALKANPPSLDVEISRCKIGDIHLSLFRPGLRLASHFFEVAIDSTNSSLIRGPAC